MAKQNKALAEVHDVVINKIFFIRGEKVMLDVDLAELYGVETKGLNQAVKRNIERFPTEFMFRLTDKEFETLRSQIVTSNSQNTNTPESLISQSVISNGRGGRRYLPYAFTEHGVLMLANVLKSQRAIAVSLRIIKVFVKMRELLLAHKDIMLKLEKMERETAGNSADIKLIFEYLRELLNPEPIERVKIGYKTNQK